MKPSPHGGGFFFLSAPDPLTIARIGYRYVAVQLIQHISPLFTTAGLFVLLIGKRLNLEIPFLYNLSIPELVSGCLLVAVLTNSPWESFWRCR